MLDLEAKLIKSIHCNSKQCVINTYVQISKELDKRITNHRLRNTKNYLISLNSFLYGSLFTNTVNMKSFQDKLKFVQDIESTHELDKLHKIGEKIVLYYLNSQSSKIKRTQNHVVNQAIKFIHLNVNKNISLEDVANYIHISKNHLSFLFSKCLNTSFSEYLNKTRIDLAKTLLMDSSLSILDIAMECGFNSQSYFCSVFKKYENITPKRYRNIKTNIISNSK